MTPTSKKWAIGVSTTLALALVIGVVRMGWDAVQSADERQAANTITAIRENYDSLEAIRTEVQGIKSDVEVIKSKLETSPIAVIQGRVTALEIRVTNLDRRLEREIRNRKEGQ